MALISIKASRLDDYGIRITLTGEGREDTHDCVNVQEAAAFIAGYIRAAVDEPNDEAQRLAAWNKWSEREATRIQPTYGACQKQK